MSSRTARWVGLLAAPVCVLLPLAGCADDDESVRPAASEQRAVDDQNADRPSPDRDSSRRKPSDQAEPPPDRPVGPTRTGKAAESFGDKPVQHRSTARARLVDLTAETGDPVAGGGHTEKVTFTFDGTEVLPKYQVGYVETVRSHPEDDPIGMTGNAFLQVDFELTNPNVRGRLAIPPDLQPGLPLTKELLVVRNIGGTLRFGVGLDEHVDFRTYTEKSPTRLVVEVREKR